MHINLHKTFSTPHGGGGPGSGPTVCRTPRTFRAAALCGSGDDGLRLVENNDDAANRPFGRMVAFHGQMGMYVRALSYMMSHGRTGCGKLLKMRC